MENYNKYQPQFFIIPSLYCPANCHYCFGPNKGSKMSEEVMQKTLEFMTRTVKATCQDKIKITFHGGEPLAARYSYFENILNGIEVAFFDKKVELVIQSNLWLLDENFCKLFYKHKVSVGTSLDGPKDITDRQRGMGYYDQTMKGVRLAQGYGLNVACIATFTSINFEFWKEIFDFFIAERINFSIHSCVPTLENQVSDFVLSTKDKATLLTNALDYYLEKRKEISVSTFDQMCRSIVSGKGYLCGFRDCLGMFLAIDPNGDIYPCQRFCGRTNYAMGSFDRASDLQTLFDSHVAGKMREQKLKMLSECKDCDHIQYCRGGCIYNAWAANNPAQARDPYCESYKKTFDLMKSRLLAEMSAEENIEAIAKNPFPEHGHILFRKGPLTEIARDGNHPIHTARNAKRIVAAVELARGLDLISTAERLVEMKISRTKETAIASLKNLQHHLKDDNSKLNNLYAHITFNCQLKCSHCYAPAENCEQGEMSILALEKLISETKNSGFRQMIITGGEPLIHHERNSILDLFIKYREQVKPMKIVLRTNFAMNLSEEEMTNIAIAFNQVVVSLDGNEITHDQRRGIGAFKSTLKNVELYQSMVRNIINAGELSFATVMRAAEIQGEPGLFVKKLARNLGIKRIRFRPLLPIGRAKEWDEPLVSEALCGYMDSMEMIENGFHPCSTCGIGQNLYVEPSGESFPCYSYHEAHTYIGNVIENGLTQILNSDKFKELSLHGVDTNPKCKKCEFKYLCGGACRAWGGDLTKYNLDAPPPECDGLKQRAINLYNQSLKYLNSF